MSLKNMTKRWFFLMMLLKSIRNTLMQLLIKETHISNKNSMKMPYYNMIKQFKLTLRASRLLIIKGLYINNKKNMIMH